MMNPFGNQANLLTGVDAARDFPSANMPGDSKRHRPPSGGEAFLSRFLSEVSHETSSLRPSTACHEVCRMAIQPGGPNPAEWIKFAEASGRFIDAARRNDLKALTDAEHDMTFSGMNVSWEKRKEAYQAALLEAARHDSLHVTNYLIEKENRSYAPDPKNWTHFMEAAFVTACRHGAYDTVGFYLGEALGETYVNQPKLRPEVMAWGIYRSSESHPAHELLEKVAVVNPEVARIYAVQMNFLRHAKNGEETSLQEGFADIGQDCPFVFREAAECAIEGGHRSLLTILLPRVPLGWLPELIETAGGQGRLDMVSELMNHIERTHKQLHYFGSSYGGEREAERFYEERLIGDALRGAAQNGQLEAVKELASRLHQTGRCKIAATAAIEKKQTAILAWAVSEVGRADSPGYRLKEDSNMLKELMTAALENENYIARDLLLTEKGGALCVGSDHVCRVAKERDQESFDAFLASGVSRHELSFALRRLCQTLMSEKVPGKESSPPPSFLIDLFGKTLPLQKTNPVEQREEELIARDRAEAFSSLAGANQHEIISELLKAAQIDAEAKAAAFLNAVGLNQKEAFSLLLPYATKEGLTRSFKAIAGIDHDWTPVKGSRAFLTALIDAGVTDPKLLKKAAIYLSNVEAWEKEGAASPAALSIINHLAFPVEAATEVLIATGLNGNTRSKEALLLKPGVSAVIGELYQAVLDKDLMEIVCLTPRIPRGQEEALQKAAEHCIDKEFSMGARQIIRQAADKLDLSQLASAAQFKKDYAALQSLVHAGLAVNKDHITHAVEHEDEAQLNILLEGKFGPQAASIYLAELDSDTSISGDWKSRIAESLAYLRHRVSQNPNT